MIVLGKRGEAADFASGHLGSNVDRIARSSHKPCLVTPRDFQPIDRILVAYDGSLTGKKILQFLVENYCFKRLKLHLLKVTKNDTYQRANTRITEGRNRLQEAGFEPVCSVIEGETEKAIANYITQHDISLLLMGAYGHSRIRHLVIGSTTAQLLRSSNIPVLLFR